MSLAGETIATAAVSTTRPTTTTITAATTTEMPNLVIELSNAKAAMESGLGVGTGEGMGMGSGTTTTTTTATTSSDTLALITDYAGFADIYLNTFYCLAVICLVSVFDR